jgi:hypothetical protein
MDEKKSKPSTGYSIDPKLFDKLRYSIGRIPPQHLNARCYVPPEGFKVQTPAEYSISTLESWISIPNACVLLPHVDYSLAEKSRDMAYVIAATYAANAYIARLMNYATAHYPMGGQ